MQLDALIRALSPSEVTGGRPVEIADLAYDTRTVTDGALFFCVVGERVDGHDLAWEAIERGAAAVVVERSLEVDVPQLVVPSVRESMPVAADVFFGEPTKELELAGVTGTNGKTTTAFLLRAILGAAGRRPGLVGTVEWEVGGRRRPAPFTTPEAIDLQRLFRKMLDAGDRSAAVEASSHGSAHRRLDRVRFDVLVFTNLTQDHLDLHGSMDDYFQAKRRLFTGPQPPPAAINVGDEWGDGLPATCRTPTARRWSRSAFPTMRRSARRISRLRRREARFAPRASRSATPLRGLFNVENVLGTVAAGILLDFDEDAIAQGIAGMSAVPGRFEAIEEGQPFAVVVDYAHTPDSLSTVLHAARALGDGRVIVVFGAGGDRDRGKRPLMGRVAADNADVVIVTSDNPRSEEPLAIIQDVLQGAGLDVEIDPDRRSAIGRAFSLADAGDVVVIAGKGHEQGQDVGGVVTPFDDRDVARELLRERS